MEYLFYSVLLDKQELPKPVWQPNVLPNTSSPTLPVRGKPSKQKEQQIKIKRTGVFPK